MIQFHIDKERCIQCGECAVDCPAEVIVMDDFPKIVNEDGCSRCQHCLAICPTGALSILGRNPDDSTLLAGNLPEPDQMETLIKGRRSVRKYTDKDLPASLIDELLAVACHAPTGVNSQAVLFSVVREGVILAELRERVISRLIEEQEAGNMPEGFVGQYLGAAINGWRDHGRDLIFRGAPHLLIASAPQDSPCPVQDSQIALTTFQLMAHACGIGTVWDGMFMMALAVCPDLGVLLGIPEEHLVGYAMVFGEPAVEYHRVVQRGPAQVNVVQLGK